MTTRPASTAIAAAASTASTAIAAGPVFSTARRLALAGFVAG